MSDSTQSVLNSSPIVVRNAVTRTSPGVSAAGSAKKAPLSIETIHSLLSRAAREILSPDLAASVESWMSSTHGEDVNNVINNYLDSLALQDHATRGSGVNKMKDAFGSIFSRSPKNVIPLTEYPDVRMSSYVLQFGPEHAHPNKLPNVIEPVDIENVKPSASGSELIPCAMGVTHVLKFEVRNTSKQKALLSLRPLQSFGSGECVLSVNPSTLQLKKGESGTATLTITLLKPQVVIDALIVCEIHGGNRLLMLARAECEPTVFGLPLEEVPVTSSLGYDGIPIPLAVLGEMLLSDPRNLQTEGIFRVAASNDEKMRIRDALNKGFLSPSALQRATLLAPAKEAILLRRGMEDRSSGPSEDSPKESGGHKKGNSSISSINGPPFSAIGIAHAIKLFLRELPQPLFASIPKETLLNAISDEDCISLLGWLSPPYSTVFAWLVDLLVRVAENCSINKMDEKNLAICTGPNLFVGNELQNPMEALMTSQRAVSALLRILLARRERPAGSPTDLFLEVLGIKRYDVKYSGDDCDDANATTNLSVSGSSLSNSAGLVIPRGLVANMSTPSGSRSGIAGYNYTSYSLDTQSFQGSNSNVNVDVTAINSIGKARDVIRRGEVGLIPGISEQSIPADVALSH